MCGIFTVGFPTRRMNLCNEGYSDRNCRERYSEKKGWPLATVKQTGFISKKSYLLLVDLSLVVEGGSFFRPWLVDLGCLIWPL